MRETLFWTLHVSRNLWQLKDIGGFCRFKKRFNQIGSRPCIDINMLSLLKGKLKNHSTYTVCWWSVRLSHPKITNTHPVYYICETSGLYMWLSSVCKRISCIVRRHVVRSCIFHLNAKNTHLDMPYNIYIYKCIYGKKRIWVRWVESCLLS